MEIYRILPVLIWIILACFDALQINAEEGQEWNCDASELCYSASTRTSDRVAAAIICDGLGGKLACPSTKERRDDIYNFLEFKNEKYWIGLVSLPKSNLWQWIDGSPFKNETITWAAEHPRLNAIYAYIENRSFVSSLEQQNMSLRYICQKEKDQMSSMTTSTSTTSMSTSTATTSMSTSTATTSMSTSTVLSTSTVSYISSTTTGSQQQSPNGMDDFISSECDENSSFHSRSSSNICYYYAESGHFDWNGVKALCEEKNAHLAVPSTTDKQEELAAYIKWRHAPLFEMNIWLGLYYPDEGGVPTDTEPQNKLNWLWVDGSKYNPDSNQWNPKEPAMGEKWVRMRKGKWFATNNASDAEYFICEKDISPPNSTPHSDETTDPTEPSIHASQSTTNINHPESTSIPTSSSVTPSAATSNTELGTQTVKFKRNADVLLVILLTLPIVIIVGLVYLVKTGRLDIQPLLQRLKLRGREGASEGNIEEPPPNAANPEPYYLSTNTVIPVPDLEEYSKPNNEHIVQMHLEFESIPANMGLPQTIASKPVNKTKNRFKDVKPYDANRVELSAIPGVENADYINASLINGYQHPNAYIASCGPTQHTLIDFWRMIWEYNVKCVIMLTQLTEGAKEMCKRYWPSSAGEVEVYGDFEVILEHEDKLTDYICRHMVVKQGDEERQITQLHMESWMDMRILVTAVEILNLRREMQKFLYSKSPPVLVHCRAGVGRSGTFLALDYLLQQAAHKGVVDVAKCVAKLRRQRVKMVQNAEQYEFLYQAVAEGVLLGNTCIPVSEFLAKYPKIMEKNPSGTSKLDFEFKLMIESTAGEDKQMKKRKSVGLYTINKTKNRDKSIVADDAVRISLMTKTDGRNDYINAVTVESLERKHAIIATQAPLAGTAIDFWRAIWDYKCRIIVMLCPQEQLEMKEIYYPEMEEDSYSVPPFDIECSTVKTRKHISSKEFAVTLTEKRHVLHLNVTSDLKAKSSQELMETFLMIYTAIKKRKAKYSHTAPVLVHCLDGAEWTGMYCAFSCLLEQIECDKEIDVFQNSRLVRQSRPQFISTKDQYKKLYEMVHHYIQGQSDYVTATIDTRQSKKTKDDAEKIYDNVKLPVASTSSLTANDDSTAIYVNVQTINEARADNEQ